MVGVDRVQRSSTFESGELISGRYTYVRALGRGGMGSLHLAIARGPSGFAKQVVLKTPLVIGQATDCERESMMREARLAARLEHPNIVQTFEVLETDSFPIIVMEYLRGRTLSTVGPYDEVPNPPQLPLCGWLRVISDILQALRYVHRLRDFDGKRMGLVHRDVSPQNIFVTDEGQVKLLDFGAATASRVGEQGSFSTGKLRYMPREQLMADGVDGRADLYAVGVLLWEALSGRRLWGNREHHLVRARLLLGKGPPTEEGAIAERFKPVISKALATRECRYRTAEELEREIVDAAGGEHSLWSRSALREWIIENTETIDAADDAQSPSSRAPLGISSVVGGSNASIGLRALSAVPLRLNEHSCTERIDTESWRGPSTTKSMNVEVQSPVLGARASRRWLAALGGLGVLTAAGVTTLGVWSSVANTERAYAAPTHTSAAVVSLGPRAGFSELERAPEVADPSRTPSLTQSPARVASAEPAEGHTIRSGRSTSTTKRAKPPRPRRNPAAPMPPIALVDAGRWTIAECAYFDEKGIKRYDSDCVRELDSRQAPQ